VMEEPQRSLEYMRDPMKWTMILLPLKKADPKGGFPELGLMFDERPRVYTVSMFQLGAYKDVKLDEIPHIDYPDLEGVVDDGWRVD
jgi:hypothetical protein